MSLKDLRYTETKPRGLLFSVEGRPKCGKTEFGLSLPDPLFILNLNLSLVGVIEKHIKEGKEIYVQEIQIPLSKSLPGSSFSELSGAAADQWRRAISSLVEAIKEPSIKGLFIDTGSELWELLRIARLGKLAAVLPIQYAAVNAEFRQLLQVLLTSGKFVGLSHKRKPEYVNDQRTNRFERAGFGDIGFDVQVELLAERDLTLVGDDQYSMTFMDCRANPTLNGTVVRGKDCNFTNIARMIYPSTTAEDWK